MPLYDSLGESAVEVKLFAAWRSALLLSFELFKLIKMLRHDLSFALQYTVNHSELSVVFLESSKIATLSKALPKVKQNVTTVVYWGDASSADVEGVKKEVMPTVNLLHNKH